MVEEATECRKDPKGSDFFKDPAQALGCDMALYMSQFPQLYSGYDKRGIPLFFSKPGVLNVDAVDCITTLDGIIKFHWFFMVHDFGERLRSQKAKEPDFNRFEAVCVLDLANLSISQLGSRTLAIIKEQAFIDSLCFPETMAQMIIINAPSFFSASWSIIKGYIDARTAAKVSVFSNRTKWEKKLLEICDVDQLPSDYGGTGPSTISTLDAASPGNMKRLFTHCMYVR
jgi:CRAL/TRIO domain